MSNLVKLWPKVAIEYAKCMSISAGFSGSPEVNILQSNLSQNLIISYPRMDMTSVYVFIHKRKIEKMPTYVNFFLSLSTFQVKLMCAYGYDLLLT